ncbi:DNA-damage-inducible protein D [mine drainage metagenome]|uniref:DNA-damage-inducible protein D n=1 Tax=mine drainage metagenome TaxID=410659 RepID=A0A1J5PVH3_9ZZZZ
MNIPENRPLADFLPTISIKAKDFAAEMTGLNVQSKDLKGQNPIEKEHIDNNTAVRKMLAERGIFPENLPAADDVKKIRRKLYSDDKNVLKDTKRKKK